MTGGGFVFFARPVRVVHHSHGDAIFDQIHPLLGDALKVKGPGDPGRAQSIVPDGDSGIHHLLADPAVHETALFLHRHRAKAGPGHHLDQILSRIGLQDDAVLARFEGARILAAQALVERLAADRPKVDLIHVQRQRGCVAGARFAHDDRVDIGIGGAVIGRDAQRVGDGDLQRRRCQRARGDHASITGLQADGAGSFGSLFGRAAGRGRTECLHR